MNPRTFLRATKAIELVERTSDLTGDEAAWLEGFLDEAHSVLDDGRGVYAFTRRREFSLVASRSAFVVRGLSVGPAMQLAELHTRVPTAFEGGAGVNEARCGSLMKLLEDEHPASRDLHEAMGTSGIVDAFVVEARNGEGGTVTICAPSAHAVEPSARVVAMWRRVGHHLMSGLDLRRKVERAFGRRSADCDDVDRPASTERVRVQSEKAWSLRSALRREAESAFDPSRPRAGDARRLLEGVVRGEWSLVDAWDLGERRCLLIRPNPAHVRDPRALSETEEAIFRRIGAGVSNKEAAVALGLSVGAVSGAISRLLRKLRCRRRLELAHFADPPRIEAATIPSFGDALAALVIDFRPTSPHASALSTAERDVAGFVLRGWSNQRIARERSASVRTVANQLQSVYEKLAVSSRGELRAALSAPRP